jgi:hypothetical protein
VGRVGGDNGGGELGRAGEEGGSIGIKGLVDNRGASGGGRGRSTRIGGSWSWKVLRCMERRRDVEGNIMVRVIWEKVTKGRVWNVMRSGGGRFRNKVMTI